VVGIALKFYESGGGGVNEGPGFEVEVDKK
jgi:hypothetical protein